MATLAFEATRDLEAVSSTVFKHGVVLRFLKRHPVYFAVLLVCVFALVEFSTGSYIELGDLKHPVLRYRLKRAEKVAAANVEQLSAEVGHGVEIDGVTALPNLAGEDSIAKYDLFFRCIFISLERLHDIDSLHNSELFVSLGHEVAHAVFIQSNLFPLDESSQQLSLVGEMAAGVLGAHITGRALNREGNDRKRAAVEFLDSYQRNCFDPQRRFPNHHGPVDVISDMNWICLESPSVWTAAHRIAEEYFAVDESGAWKYRNEVFSVGQGGPVGDIPRYPQFEEYRDFACVKVVPGITNHRCS